MIPVVEELDGKLDQGIVEKFCEFVQLDVDKFWRIMDKWYNPESFCTSACFYKWYNLVNVP